MTTNRTDFVKEVSGKTGFTQKDVKTVLDAMQDIVYETMANRDAVKVFDGLTLCGVERAACTRRNPMTGESIDVPAKTAPKAKFGKFAKDSVNK